MRKSKVLGLMAGAVLLLSFGAWLAASSTTALPGEEPLQPLLLEEPLVLDPDECADTEVAEGTAELLLDEVLFARPGCCPGHCNRDSDCDFFCGAAGAGVCLPFNSCCNQCACLF